MDSSSLESAVKPGIYRHYKGNYYKVIYEAKHSETLETMVVYQALYGEYGIWVRPADMFLETVVVHGQKQQRFCYVGENEACLKKSLL